MADRQFGIETLCLHALKLRDGAAPVRVAPVVVADDAGDCRRSGSLVRRQGPLVRLRRRHPSSLPLRSRDDSHGAPFSSCPPPVSRDRI